MKKGINPISEAESVTDSLPIPKGIKSLGINPLNRKTDGTKAHKTERKGEKWL